MTLDASITLDDHRAAQAEALARAGADERANVDAERREHQLTVMLEAAEQRSQADRLAVEQARARASTEAQARRLAIEKVRAEQSAEAALRARLEAEEQACAETQRKEQALADLAAASAARAKREAELEALARERVAAERAAVAAAHERIQSEQAAETLALAKTAADQEFTRVATQRLVVEQEAAAATAARHLAEAEAQAAQKERETIEQALEEVRQANLSETVVPTAAVPLVPSPPQRLAGSSGKRIGALAAACIVAGVLVGGWIGAQLVAKPELPGAGQLKLDTQLTQRVRGN